MIDLARFHVVIVVDLSFYVNLVPPREGHTNRRICLSFLAVLVHLCLSICVPQSGQLSHYQSNPPHSL